MERKEFTKSQKHKIEKLVKQFLDIVDNSDRPGLVETPHRVMKYWCELLEGQLYTNKEIAEMFKKDFTVGYDPIVMMKIDDVFSTCEHHCVLMYDGIAIIGYIPQKNENGTFNVLGLSKIPRIVDMCSKRLQLQEKLASDIAECISLATGSKEVYVNLKMKHGCVSARGIKSRSVTSVTFMTKDLRNNIEARKEFESKAGELLRGE